MLSTSCQRGNQTTKYTKHTNHPKRLESPETKIRVLHGDLRLSFPKSLSSPSSLYKYSYLVFKPTAV